MWYVWYSTWLCRKLSAADKLLFLAVGCSLWKISRKKLSSFDLVLLVFDDGGEWWDDWEDDEGCVEVATLSVFEFLANISTATGLNDSKPPLCWI